MELNSAMAENGAPTHACYKDQCVLIFRPKTPLLEKQLPLIQALNLETPQSLPAKLLLQVILFITALESKLEVALHSFSALTQLKTKFRINSFKRALFPLVALHALTLLEAKAFVIGNQSI